MTRSLLRKSLAGIAVAALFLLARPAAAQPVIEVTPPTIAFDPVTIGDTVATTFRIANRGDATLTIADFEVPPGVIVHPRSPFDLAPDSSRIMTVEFAPGDTLEGERSLTVVSNDPTTPRVDVTWRPEILALSVETQALTTPGEYPLGEAIVVQTVPIDRVHIERSTLWFQSGNLPDFVPQEMSWNGRSFIGIIPGDFVQEGGVEFYVVVENSGFTAVDPEEGEARPFRVEVGSPGFYELDAVVRNPGFIWRVGETVDFVLQLQRGSVYDKGTLHYRRGGDSLYQETPIVELSFTGIAASIPGDWVGPRGVQYWSEINTVTRKLSDPFDQPDRFPYELRITVENLEEPELQPAGRYRMLSVPLAMPAGSGLAAILSDQPEFGAYDPVRWRAFRYLPEVGTNVELSPERAGDFQLEPGRAFWLVSRAAHQVNTAPVPGVSVTVGDPFMLILPPGWNQFGNPFAFPVAWRSVRRTVGLGLPVEYDPALGDYAEETPEVLEPFAGYFIENSSTEAETLLFFPRAVDAADTTNADTTDERRAAAAVAGPSGAVASLRIEARAAGGADLGNRVGVLEDSRDERDPWDRAEPPAAPGAPVRLAIANREWTENPGFYRWDYRAPGGEGQVWELEVTTAAAGEPVSVVVRLDAPLPAGQVLRLVDREQGTAVTLDPSRAEWSHEVLALGPARPYRLALLMGTAAFVEGASAPRVPDRLTLDPVAPNPGRGAQRLRFGLPRAAAARLEVFDASGRRVATLLDGRTLQAGHHTVIWQPGLDGGPRVPSGMYFHRLTVGGETRTVRSVRMP